MIHDYVHVINFLLLLIIIVGSLCMCISNVCVCVHDLLCC